MNRRERRRARRHLRALEAQFHALADAMVPLDGVEIPGNCPDCNAIQRLEVDGPGRFTIRVMHDSTCPELLRLKGEV